MAIGLKKSLSSSVGGSVGVNRIALVVVVFTVDWSGLPNSLRVSDFSILRFLP